MARLQQLMDFEKGILKSRIRDLESVSCVGELSPRPKQLRFQKSKVKRMLILFFDSQGIMHKEFVQEGCTVTAEHFNGVLA
jgi:hypothetical protein